MFPFLVAVLVILYTGCSLKDNNVTFLHVMLRKVTWLILHIVNATCIVIKDVCHMYRYQLGIDLPAVVG